MRRASLRLAAAALFLVALPSLAQAAPPAARAPKGNAARTPRVRGFKQTGIVATVGIDVGLPGLGAGTDHGVFITPVDPVSGKRKIAGLASINGSLGPLGAKGVWSPRRELRGVERSVGPVHRNDPIYGDRVSIPIIPGLVSLGASRKGGLGLSISGLPLPVLSYPLFRGGFSIYVMDPRLVRVSGPLLDGVDRVIRGVQRLVHPVTERLQPLTTRVANAARPVTDWLAAHRGPSAANAPSAAAN